MKVLSVAEKPSIAKALAGILSRGGARAVCSHVGGVTARLSDSLDALT